MRKMFWQMMTTLDGYMEGRDHDIEWFEVDEEFATYVEQMGREIDDIVFGRVTYEMMAGYWPTSQEPEAPMMNELPKLVFSRTLKDVAWSNSRLATRSIDEEISELKSRTGKDIAVFGSADLASSLLRRGLIDEVRLFVSPLALGQGNGAPLFKGNERHEFRLIDSRPFRIGSVLLTYEPRHAGVTAK